MYDGPREPYTPNPNDGKVRARSWFRRHQPFVITIIVLLVLLIVAVSAIAVLLNRPTAKTTASAPTPTATTVQDTPATTPTPELHPTPTQQVLTPTQTGSTPTSDTNISPSTKNYQFVCLDGCGDKLTAILDNIDLNTSNQTMTWNFTITNNGDLCNGLYGLVKLESPSGDTISQDNGSLGDCIPINTNQSLPKTATFSTIPQKGTVYTVTFDAYCNNGPTYQPALFSY